MTESVQNHQLLEWREGVAYFHGVRVDHRVAHVAGRELKLAVLKDAAELLDLPHFEKLFVETDRLPYGLELWPASQILSELILKGEPGQGRNAVEIGCGLGLVGIAATVAGWHVRATDIDPMALDFARMNGELNDVAVAEWGELDWRNPPTDRKYDRVFGADILYELVHHAPILSCVRQLLAPGGVAMISDPHRGVADRVADMAKDAGFDVQLILGEAPNHLGQTIKGRVFVLRLPVTRIDKAIASESKKSTPAAT